MSDDSDIKDLDHIEIVVGIDDDRLADTISHRHLSSHIKLDNVADPKEYLKETIRMQAEVIVDSWETELADGPQEGSDE